MTWHYELYRTYSHSGNIFWAPGLPWLVTRFSSGWDDVFRYST